MNSKIFLCKFLLGAYYFQLGIHLLQQALPANPANPVLFQSNLRHGELVTSNVPVYPTIEAAVPGNKKQETEKLNPSFAIISYDRSEELDGK